MKKLLGKPLIVEKLYFPTLLQNVQMTLATTSVVTLECQYKLELLKKLRIIQYIHVASGSPIY